MLHRYWPREDQIDQCIRAEAETASEAVLLAVHQPMRLTVRNAGSQEETAVTESDFLEAFLTPHLPEGTLLQAVTGASGAGKSHLIRWLAAQLRYDPRADRMVIVRIPKSASLRTVVELILEPLGHDERFQRARTDLQQAVAEVTAETGAIRLAGGLEIALRKLADGLTARLLADPQSPNRRELMARLDHARRLPALFNDAALEAHFKPNVLARIVARAVRGSDQHQDDASLPQFAASDLVVPDSVDLGQAAQQVRNYYQTVLNRDGGQGFARAADVLNEVVDDAIREAFRLGQAMGGMTLEEIILRIRQVLFEDDRELVLLVEDFAALSGIQEVLLRVCIQEAERDGKAVRARMCTALAVTDGYLASRDTILTRARREWLVKTALATDEEVIAGTTAMVASYLNAARWGSSELERRFLADAGGGNLTTWVTTFGDENLSDEEVPVLDAFGKGPHAIPLFPYNPAAIRSLAVRHLSDGGRLQFLPRRIINYILRDVLIRRSEFERGLFPPKGFEGARPMAEVAAWLTRAVPTAETRERLGSVLAHWGGNPSDPSVAAGLPTGLFVAFQLPTPQDLGQAPVPVRPQPRPAPPPTPLDGGGVPTPPPTPKVPPLESPEFTRWGKTLQAWSTGEQLGQQDALALRDTIKSLLLKTINWNAGRFSRSVAPSSLLIFIPNAAGNLRSAKATLQIADDHTDTDGRLRRSLMALVRYRHNGMVWSYEGGDEDGALVANFIDGLAERYTADVERQAEEEAVELANVLLRQAQTLGLSTQGIGRPSALAQAIRAAPPERNWADFPEDSPEARWQQLQQASCKFRPELQELLLARLGCFQGTGNTAYALDAVRLWEGFRSKASAIPRELEQGLVAAHAKDLSDLRVKARISPVRKDLEAYQAEMRTALGESFSKDAYVAETKLLLEVIEKAGVWPTTGFVKKSVYDAIEGFRATPLKELLDRIARITAFDDQPSMFGRIVTGIAQVDLLTVARSRRFVREMKIFLDAVDQRIAREEQTAGGVDSKAKAAELDDQLRAIADDLGSLISLDGTHS